MVYKKDTNRLLADPALLALTNEFISTFFELYAAKHGGKRDDGYAFGYNLIECLLNSDYLNNCKEDGTEGLLGMGCVQNVVNGYFERNVNDFELDTKIAFILNNYDKQEPYDDWRVTDYITTTSITIVEEFDMDVMLSRVPVSPDRPAIYKVEKPMLTQSFHLFNSKSGYSGVCEVISIDGLPNAIKLYNKGKIELQLTVDIKTDYNLTDPNNQFVYNVLEPKIHHYKYVADINGFINVINQVYYGIKYNYE